MKLHTKTRLTALAATAALTAGSANAVTIFDDDFEDTAIYSIGSDAVMQTTLNAGVATGSWTVAEGEESKVMSEDSNKGFVMDRGVFDVTSTFSQAGVVGADATTITLDFHSSRENNPKDYFFIGLQGATELFRITVKNPGLANSTLTPDTSTDELENVTFSSGNLDTSDLRTITITLSATSYDIWLDSDNDGIVDATATSSNELLSDVAYTNNPTTGITALRFLGTNEIQSGSGVAIDNFLVTTVPEPTSLALITLGGLLIARRRHA